MKETIRNQLKEDAEFCDKQLSQVLSFWGAKGFDEKHGGFYTYLDEEGKRFSEVKSVWAQGRAMYIYAKAYSEIEANEQWLKWAEETFVFLQKHGFDNDRKMYFSLTGDGRPIRRRRYWFSDAFMALGACMLYDVTKRDEYLRQMRESYNRITAFYFGREMTPPKYEMETINAKSIADSMILLNLIQHIAQTDPINQKIYEADRKKVRANITDHVHQGKHVFLENVSNDNTPLEGPMGRLVNPGHSLEAAWFLLDEYNVTHEKKLLDLALETAKGAYEVGWDETCGGLFYFADIENKPLEQLEWDMKLWWPHTEASIAFLKAYEHTGDEMWYQLYSKVLSYLKEHFVTDKEWWGYLHRDNTLSHRLKGNLFKGPFHVPRMLLINRKIIQSMLKKD